MSEDARIDALLNTVMEADIEPAERDQLVDDLKYAQDINGSPDPALQGIKRITISGVRKELLAHARLKKHVSDCPLRKEGQDDAVAGTGVAKALALIKALTPWRWPAAIAIFSPWAPDVTKQVLGFFK